MASSSTTNAEHEPELVFDMPPLIRVYKDGRVVRLTGNDSVPPSDDPKTGVISKDIAISADISARTYLPKLTDDDRSTKLPLLIYFHGGAFCVEMPSSPKYHNYLNTLVSHANVVAVSVNYRLAPEHPLPTAYEDSWAALKWVGSHSARTGSDQWLNEYADFERIFLAGDSAGGNIAHHMAMRFGENEDELNGGKIEGIVLVHPYFWAKDLVRIDKVDPGINEFIETLWLLACPGTSGSDDDWINPAKDGASLAKLGCRRVLICVAEKDTLRGRNWDYYEKLRKSGWGGKVDILQAKGEQHIFHLVHPNTENENAMAMLDSIIAFINGDC